MDATARHTTITIRVRSVNIAPDSMCSDLFRFKATIPIMQEKGTRLHMEDDCRGSGCRQREIRH